MSTEVTVADKAVFEASVQDVRRDSIVKFVVVIHPDGDPSTIGVLSTGSDLRQLGRVLDNRSVMHILARLNTTVNVSESIKFVYIHWVGPDVPFTKRAKYEVVRGSVEKYFHPYHVQINAESADDVTVENMLQALESAARRT